MRFKLKRWIGIGTLLLVLALTIVACGQTPAAQSTAADAAGGEPIKIGALFDLTGPTSDVGKFYSEGIIAYVDWKNAQGGVQGHKLELIHADYAYQLPKAEELYTKYVTQDKVVAFSGWGTADTEALKGKITQDKIPFVSASYAATLGDPAQTPYNFLVGTTYGDQLIIAQKWALEDWRQKGNSGAPKFAYLINDSPFGKSPVEDGKKHAAANGVSEPLVVPSPKGATDLTAQLTQIKDSGANYVFLQNVPSPAALALKNAKALGLTPQTQFVCLNWCANGVLIKLAGDAAEGVVGALPFDPAGAEGAKQALAYASAQHLDIASGEGIYVQAWWSMAILVEGMDRTLTAGKPVNGENMKAALETLKDFTTGGVVAPITFTTTNHRGNNSLKLYQIKGGKWESITGLVAVK
jgi:branched-chain amino acid transport system substrate-binding protein